MAWEVEVSDEFKGWYENLTRHEQKSVALGVRLLQDFGPSLGRPQVDAIRGSEISNMKELRVQHRGRPYRILFAFDPRRNAYLILGGDKTGKDDWYESAIPKADAIQATLDRDRRIAMSHKWADVRGKFSDEDEAELQQRYEEEVKKLSLHQVRQARNLTQVNLATLLNVNQGSVSKLEKRADMYVSTLRSYIQAMGGELQIKAIFPDGEVQIGQFHELAP